LIKQNAGTSKQTDHSRDKRAKRFALLSLLSSACFIFLALTSSVDAVSLSEQAAAAWASRDKPGQTEEAIRLWQEATKAEPEQADYWLKLSKAFGRAVRRSQSSDEQKKYSQEALHAAEKAVQLAPQSSDAYAAHGEAIGQWANARKGVGSLKSVKKAVAALEKAIELNPKNAYAHMLLAEFYRQAPAVISIGDKKKALEHARLAVEHGPAYAIHHLSLARALIDNNQKEEAVKELNVILQLETPPDAIPETQADQKAAKTLLEQLGATATGTSSSCEGSTPQCTSAP
jgi:tetratricopeptide (TPR) repeat protein